MTKCYFTGLLFLSLALGILSCGSKPTKSKEAERFENYYYKHILKLRIL
jgi:hypothetical protein